jgi:uncharacterized protein
MNPKQVLPQIELPHDLNGLRRVDFTAHHSYYGSGFLLISDLPRVADAVSSIDPSDGFDYKLSSEVRDIPGSQTRETLSLEIRGRLHLVCQRCLKDCPQVWTEKRQFLIMASEADADAYPVDDDLYEPLVASRHFDLLELIEDEILLSFPLIPKHEEGACKAHNASQAIKEKNASAEQKRENPFNILKNMKKN